MCFIIYWCHVLYQINRNPSGISCHAVGVNCQHWDQVKRYICSVQPLCSQLKRTHYFSFQNCDNFFIQSHNPTQCSDFLGTQTLKAISPFTSGLNGSRSINKWGAKISPHILFPPSFSSANEWRIAPHLIQYAFAQQRKDCPFLSFSQDLLFSSVTVILRCQITWSMLNRTVRKEGKKRG